MNADGTIYGRYSTRSIAGPMAHNSMKSLKNAMKRALQLHENYPTNKASLAGKRGAKPKWKKALDIPALRRQFAKKLMQPAGRGNCIHCHTDGMKERMTGPQFNLWIKLNYHEGDKLPIQVIRKSQTISLTIPLE